MSSAALKAHIRLLESDLPRKTHAARKPEYSEKGRPGARPSQQTAVLHARIMVLAAQGHLNFEIAAILGITPSTVGKHRRGLIKMTRK